MVDATSSPAIAFSWSNISQAAPAQTVVGMSANASVGYWLVTETGSVHAFGGAPNYGSATLGPGVEIVGMSSTPNGGGYWLVTSNGAIYAFGNAGWHGAANHLPLSAPIVGMTSTPDGGGYWLVGADGGVFSFGNASFHGSTGDLKLNKPIVGIASTSDGEGYWLVASDGGVFSFGNARFHGSTGGMTLNRPVVGMTPVERRQRLLAGRIGRRDLLVRRRRLPRFDRGAPSGGPDGRDGIADFVRLLAGRLGRGDIQLRGPVPRLDGLRAVGQVRSAGCGLGGPQPAGPFFVIGGNDPRSGGLARIRSPECQASWTDRAPRLR